MSEYTVQTGEPRVVALPSAIESVRWSRSRAAPGATVGLKVQTVFCGEGSRLEVHLIDAHGTCHAKLSGQLHNNQVDVGLRVPDEAEGGLVAKVEMPNHGLSAQSEALTVAKAVKPSSPRWSTETARRGDLVTATADARGASDGELVTLRIFEDDRSGAHRPITRLRTRVDGGAVEAQYHFQYPGSTARIVPEWNAPDGYEHPTFFFTVSVMEVESTSRTAKRRGSLRFLDDLSLQVLDAQSESVYADRAVDLTFADGSETSKTTDESGRVDVMEIPPGPVKVAFPDLGSANGDSVDPIEHGRDVLVGPSSNGSTSENGKAPSSTEADAAATIPTGPTPFRLWVPKNGTVPTG